MVRTPSRMMNLGTQAPQFYLLDVISKQRVSLPKNENGQVQGTVVMFICNHCPYVKHIIKRLSAVIAEYQRKNINFFAINSNDIEQYPEDSPNHMQQFAQEFKLNIPYLYDETQEVAHAYGAACTPDFFIYDQSYSLVYRGQFDDSRPGNEIAVTGNSLCSALDALIEKQPIPANQQPSLGCNIKWKP